MQGGRAEKYNYVLNTHKNSGLFTGANWQKQAERRKILNDKIYKVFAKNIIEIAGKNYYTEHCERI